MARPMAADFSVVAIIAAYNEADIIGPVVAALIEQGVDVYLLDDGSTDGTIAAVEPFVGQGVRGIERRAPASASNGAPPPFEWERLLRRKMQLATELEASWFIHHDADEFRESPWAHLSLRDAIRQVDTLGYNAIDFASLDFWPTGDEFRAGADVREAFTRYGEQMPYDRVQIRCWKKTAAVDLASSGGHDAQFPGRNVFPVRFILRHYPIRGQRHGERKIFEERRNRFLAEERARGWHVQYDQLRQGASLLRDPGTLVPYDGDAVRVALTLRHRGVEALEASLDESRSLAEARRREIDNLRAEVSREHDQLTSARDELARTHDALVRTGADLEAARASLQARVMEADGLRAALDQRDAAIDGWCAVVADRDRRLDDLHRSWSWRLTSPLRAILDLLRASRRGRPS
jgi:hypothetical protein